MNERKYIQLDTEAHIEVLDRVHILHQENERLKQENEVITMEVETLQNSEINNQMNLEIATKEIEQLKQSVAEREEALRKCSPYYQGCYGGENKCNFCNTEEDYGHKDDCDYVRLTGGAV